MSDIEIKFKIKLSNDSEITLSEVEARSLYYKLDGIFKDKMEWPFPNYPATPIPIDSPWQPPIYVGDHDNSGTPLPDYPIISSDTKEVDLTYVGGFTQKDYISED